MQWGASFFSRPVKVIYMVHLTVLYVANAAWNVCVFVAAPLQASVAAGVAVILMNSLMYFSAASAGVGTFLCMWAHLLHHTHKIGLL